MRRGCARSRKRRARSEGGGSKVRLPSQFLCAIPAQTANLFDRRVVPELSDSYSGQVLTGVEQYLIEEGYFYLTASHRRKPDLIEEYRGC